MPEMAKSEYIALITHLQTGIKRLDELQLEHLLELLRHASTDAVDELRRRKGL